MSPYPLEETFSDFALRAAGYRPYPYQVRIAQEGLPDLLRAPTGAGKTLAASLTWLWRRRLHPDPDVRAATPHWLVFVLPMRVLVEQTGDAIDEWLRRADMQGEVGLHSVMGGEGRIASAWRNEPDRDAIFVGTLDMLLSRALNRGYAASRFSWPIDFGLFNSGCQWVFDEVQLMGPALPTSRQLEGLRRKLGTALPTSSMWMSATVDESRLPTVDLPDVGRVVELADEDRRGQLSVRLAATRTLGRIEVDPKHVSSSLAEHVGEAHRPGTLTIAVLNTVQQARDTWKAVQKTTEAPAVLLHSRFRPGDRARHVADALAAVDKDGPGRIVISTQVIEAGVDISATTLITEAAPWSSIVQRAGRCNRDGRAPGARLLWFSSGRSTPYEEEDVEASVSALTQLDGSALTGTDLGGRPVPVIEPIHPVLRRKDLVGLFDTTPDLSGNDLDVGRFIRSGGDLDVQVAWRQIDGRKPEGGERPTRDELCPVPIGELRNVFKKGERVAWRFDHLDAEWIPCWPQDLRPGQVVMIRSKDGGYDPSSGWDPGSRLEVVPVDDDVPFLSAGVEEAVSEDPMSCLHVWVRLGDHLAQTEEASRQLAAALLPTGLTDGQLEATAVAARLHDVGKAHESFQAFLLSSQRDDEEPPTDIGPWAKAGGSRRPRHERKYFRHELASALAILADPRPIEIYKERDLILFLVAGHHGRIRLGIRSLPDEGRPPDDPTLRVAMGIWDGDELPEVALPIGGIGPVSLDLSPMELGDRDGQPSWATRMIALRDRPDLGPFRLAFLEAIVRLADWRASAAVGGDNL